MCLYYCRQPSSQPICQPSQQPISHPSSQPSSFPTFNVSSLDVTSQPQVALVSSPAGLVIPFHNLGAAASDSPSRPLYLHVTLHSCMLDRASGAFIEVAVASSSSSSSILPDAASAASPVVRFRCDLPASSSCSTEVLCAANVDVSSVALSDSMGGSLFVHAKMNVDEVNGASMSPCIYRGLFGVLFAMSARLTLVVVGTSCTSCKFYLENIPLYFIITNLPLILSHLILNPFP